MKAHQLSWTHHAEFAGLIAAGQQCHFAAEGLQVSFLRGEPEVDFIVPVADGTAQFCIAQPAEVILAQAEGRPMRAIATIHGRSPTVFIALANSDNTDNHLDNTGIPSRRHGQITMFRFIFFHM